MQITKGDIWIISLWFNIMLGSRCFHKEKLIIIFVDTKLDKSNTPLISTSSLIAQYI